MRSAPLVRVLDLPRPFVPDGQPGSADPFGLERAAQLVSAFHSGDEPVGLVWLRPRDGAPVELYGMGRPVLPLAARTEPAANIADRLAAFPAWSALSARFEGRRTQETSRPDPASRRPCLEDGLLSVWTGPFALVVVATPVRGADLADVLRHVAGELKQAAQHLANPDRAVEHERLKAWHRELWEAETRGMWRIGVWAGGLDVGSASAVAGLTVASVDLSESAYAWTPGTPPQLVRNDHGSVVISDSPGESAEENRNSLGRADDVSAAARAGGPQRTAGARQPTAATRFLAGSEFVAAIARTPVREVPGIRLVLQPDFDVAMDSPGFIAAASSGQETEGRGRPGEREAFGESGGTVGHGALREQGAWDTPGGPSVHGDPASRDRTSGRGGRHASARAETPDPAEAAGGYAGHGEGPASVPGSTVQPGAEGPGNLPGSTADAGLAEHAALADHAPAARDRGVRLGSVLDRALRPCGDLWVPLSSLNRHTFVCGATGSGKSQTVRHLLEEATRQGIPWLVLEPAKAEYARMATRLPDHEVVVVRPGDPNSVPAGIDPLRPAEGFPLQTHLDLVRALFLAAFDADEPFPQVLSAALTKAYEEQGWDVVLGEPRDRRHTPRYPTLADLEQTALRVVDDIGYGKEVADNVRGFVKVRLSSLRMGTTGRFLEGGHPFDIGKLLRSNVVLEIEDVGDDRDKSFMIGTVLIALTEHLRMVQRQGDGMQGSLHHLTVIEEAHRLLRRTEGHGAAAQAVEMFASLLAEVRAYGEGLVVAEQIPEKLIPDVIKNTAVKVVHRLPAKDDRDAVGATMNLSTSQSDYLVTLQPGCAGAFSDGMDQPLLIRMPDGTDVENSGPVTTVGPDQIVRPTSGRCFADYGLVGTSLADLVRGQRLVEEKPIVRWWCELAVLAHLSGATVPDYNLRLRKTLSVDSHVLACGLAYAVDEAVAARSGLLVKRMSPAELAQHVHRSLSEMVDDRFPCSSAEPSWLAPPFLWEYVRTDLEAFIAKEPPERLLQQHPQTAQWNAMYGRWVPGETCYDQLRTVDRWREEALRNSEVEEVAFGRNSPSALELSVGALRTDPEWPEHLRRMVRWLDAPWAEPYLMPMVEE